MKKSKRGGASGKPAPKVATPTELLCRYCGQLKLRESFVSQRKCFDCAQFRKCYTCGEVKPVSEFSQRSKGCRTCRVEHRAEAKKSAGSAERYQQNRVEMLDHNRKWKTANKYHYKSQQRDYRNERRLNIRNEVLEHYGGECACCREREPMFLTIDHIEGNGWQHRRMLGKTDMWLWLYHNDYPDGFRLLCYNCNAGRYRNGGACPHESKEKATNAIHAVA